MGIGSCMVDVEAVSGEPSSRNLKYVVENRRAELSAELNTKRSTREPGEYLKRPFRELVYLKKRRLVLAHRQGRARGLHEVPVTDLDISSGDLPERERSSRPVWLCNAENLTFASESMSRTRFTKLLHILQTPSYKSTGRVSCPNTV